MKARRFAPILIALPVLASGCAILSRSNSDAEKAAEKDGNNRYSATEPAAPDSLKDQKIQHLESTVTHLNTRIQELEGKLQAAEVRPTPSNPLEASAKNSIRQNVDAPIAGARVRPTVSANDPGAGLTQDAAVRAFQQGRALFDQEKYPEAILAFSAFLESNPGHALASSAQYTIAESYYREGDYAVADQEFQRLAARYPHSPRMSYALVRLSQSAGALGKSEEAKRYRTQAEGLFPKSPALKLFGQAPTSVREAPGATAESANAAAPIATAPDLAIANPAMPAIAAPRVEAPTIEHPVVEAPRAETPGGNAPRARVSGEELDAPPGGGG